ncbi:hypothetical protein B0A48_08909 [Cryoendolithus antarcticus]|uniref:Carboxylic ester hydrolase n=1 Tax=Cryoendolithus antarcticus TaxID=1507870 RepID=A0A1V8T4P4_9PEZI|nr:hypothetical protein B0A48_08909 [Cryoendolithus antarcticus]
MRFDVPLVTVSLAASVAAHPHHPSPSGSWPARNATNATAWNSYAEQEHKHVVELETELAALKKQLDEANHTCDNPSGLPVGPAGSSPASSGSPAGYSGAATSSAYPTAHAAQTTYLTTTVINGVTKTVTVTAAAGYSTANAGPVTSSAGDSPAGYGSSPSDPTTYLTTTVVNGVTKTLTVTVPVTVSSGPTTSLPATPDYYAPAPPASSSSASDIPTYTVIVTPGHSAPTSAYNAGPKTAHTCTETYLGTAPIPSSPAPVPSSYISSSIPSYVVPSSTGSAPVYGNGTYSTGVVGPTAVYPTGGYSTGVSSGPTGYGTGVSSSSASGIYPISYGTGVSSSASAYATGSSTTSCTSSDGCVPWYITVSDGTIPGYGSPTGSYGTGASSGLPAYSTSGSAVYPISYSTGASSGFQTYTANSTSSYPTGTAPTYSSSASSTAPSSIRPSGIAPSSIAPSSIIPSTTSSSTSSALPTATDCATFCSTLTSLNGYEVTPLTCTKLKAGVLVNTPVGQSKVGCAASFTPAIDVCQVTLNVKTSGTGQVYQEVWLPTGNATYPSQWNGRTMSTDNGGLNGCIHYVDMQYVSSMGFAAIGDNAGHNGSSFDGTWTMGNNEAIIDWSYRARHASIDIGKQVVKKFYSKASEYSYYIGCSTGGAQGLKSAQNYPNDFDGIIAGASAADFNHLQSWSAHFRLITGTAGNDTFLTLPQWGIVQAEIIKQCDESIDGVADGILEDPLECNFDSSAIQVCSATVTANCLTATQLETVDAVYKPLYDTEGKLLYPGLLHGSEYDAFKLGLLSGSVQGIAQDFFRGGVYNSSSFDITKIGQQNYADISALDALHGYPSAFSGDLSAFSASGNKLMMYHGMADPMTSGSNSQRYYQKVAKTMGTTPAAMDDYLRLFRISGMAHCGVGGISGAGAWMFGQSGASSAAPNNIVSNLVDWVEAGKAPETLLGTKFWYDTPSLGIEFQRPHCKYPLRTTYKGGDSTKAESWGCEQIQNWDTCEGTTCSFDGTFT